MSTLEVNKITPAGSGTTVTLGDSGDNIDITSGATVTNFKSTGIDDNATSTAVTIDSSERILKGHTSSITTGSRASAVQITGTSAADSSLSMMRFNSSGGPAELIMGQSRNSTIGGNTIVQNADNVGMIQFVADDGTDYASKVAEIRCDIDASTGANDTPGRLRFSTTADGANSTTERMRITSSGDVVIGKTNPAFNNTAGVAIRNFNAIQVERANACLDLNRMNTNGSIILFYRGATNNVGSISADGGSTSYNTSSDHRLKENVIDLADATTRVKQLQPKRFSFIADETNTLKDGFLAHEVSSVVPEAITGTHNGVKVWGEDEELPEGVSVGDNKLDDEGNTIPEYQGIDQSKLVPLLTASLKEAIAKIEELETRIATLENA